MDAVKPIVRKDLAVLPLPRIDWLVGGIWIAVSQARINDKPC